jgi:hypothetical protein
MTVGMLAVTTALALSVTAKAHADSPPAITYQGTFDAYRGTEMKRLAACAFGAWFDRNHVAGGRLTSCDGAGTDPKYDTLGNWTNLTSMTIDGEHVEINDDNCPEERGDYYIKCWYMDGQSRGASVMTVSTNDWHGQAPALISWHYML